MVELLIIAVVLFLCVKPFGKYMAQVMNGAANPLTPIFSPVERAIYQVAGIQPKQEMTWAAYAFSVLVFGLLGFLLLYVILLSQGMLPLNPQSFPGVSPDLAFNIAISFLTNTNWQSYSGETTLSYFSQMVGLGVQNFLSAATGIAVAMAMFRGFARKQTAAIGNFWVDVTRVILYILLPLSVVLALALGQQGVVQSFDAYVANGDVLQATGPAASQVAIKQLGSNGGGFFNANSAHPLENPTPLSNLLQLLGILLLPACILYMFGVVAGDRRQGVALLVTVSILFLSLTALSIHQERQVNPAIIGLGVDGAAGNMEGKETRLGTDVSALWATATTATSNGSVNAAHSSYMPLSGLVQLLMMQFGEVVFGGVGSGAYGLLLFVIVTVFLGGLMVGRTPEYLGKKLGPFEMKMASIGIIAPCAFTLLGTAIALSSEAGRAGVFSSGTHGFSEVLYAFTSAGNNNGSAFGGLSANTPFYNLLLGTVMFLSRYIPIIAVLAIAGQLAAKNSVPASAGTMPTHTPLFVVMLIGVIIIIGVLTYMPSLALGPVVEHLRLIKG